MRYCLALLSSGGRGGLIKAPWFGLVEPSHETSRRCMSRARMGDRPIPNGFGKTGRFSRLFTYINFMLIFVIAPLLGGLMGGRTSLLLDLLVRTDTFLGSVWGFRGVPCV